MNPINFLEKLQIIFFIRNPSTIWQKEKIKFMRNTRKLIIEVIGIGGHGFNTPPPFLKVAIYALGCLKCGWYSRQYVRNARRYLVKILENGDLYTILTVGGIKDGDGGGGGVKDTDFKMFWKIYDCMAWDTNTYILNFRWY